LRLNSLSVIINSENKYEIIRFYNDLTSKHEILEKESDKYIYTIIKKVFTSSNMYDSKIVLSDLTESKYIIPAEKIINYSNFDLAKLCLEMNIYVNELATVQTEFKIQMNFCHSESTKTEFNGEDVSYLYDIIGGEDKIYRIYDLYRGVINSRNVQDINSIKLCHIPALAFNLWNKKYQEKLLLSTCIKYMNGDKENEFALKLIIGNKNERS